MAGVRRIPSGQWEARWYVTTLDGTRKRRSKLLHCSTEHQALREAHALEAADRAAAVALDERSARGSDVRSAIDRYLTTAKLRLTERSWIDLETKARLHVVPLVGRIPLTKLTSAHVEEMLLELDRKGLSPQSSLHCLYLLSASLKQAQRAGLVQHNVTELVHRPRLRRREVKAASVQDVFTLVAWCDQQGVRIHDELAMAIRISATTGGRLGEVMGLRWSDFDKPNRTVRYRRSVTDYTARRGDPSKRERRMVEVKETKTGAAGVPIPLPEQLVERLDAYYLGRDVAGPWLFPGPPDVGAQPEPLPPSTMISRFNRAIKESGAAPFTFHQLRHMFATRSIREGIPVPVVASLLRHARASTTSDIYWHVHAEAGQVDRRSADIATRELGPAL